MSLNEYKEAIKNMVDSTNDEKLLMYWKLKLEWDLQNPNSAELSAEEWHLVQEGITEYGKGEIISFEDFISKRK